MGTVDSEGYQQAVRLLFHLLPDIAREGCFALKGGTAINMYYRDMPRYSVDIDLTYLPRVSWEEGLAGIDAALDGIVEAVLRRNSHFRAHRNPEGGGGGTRIVVNDGGGAGVKIETTPVMRGTVLPARRMRTSAAATEQFGMAETIVASFEDVYAGKLNAALDRQHPRDIFDVMVLYQNEGITDRLFRVFLTYLAGSRRPLHELLAPACRMDEAIFDAEFKGMARNPVPFSELVDTHVRLTGDIQARLTGDIAAFLLSLHDAEPDFSLLGLPDAANLPAVRWKVMNLERLIRENRTKHGEQRGALEALLR